MPLEPSHHRSWLNRLSPKAQGVIAINAAAVIFGTAALYGKLNVSPVWIVAMRAGFGALTLALIGAWKRDFSSFPRRHWQPLLLSGLLLAVHWVTFFVSVQQAGVAVATLTFATFPLFIIVAVALLVDPQAGQRNLWGAVSGLVSGFSYALFWRSSKKLDDAALSATNLSFWQNAMVFALLMPALFFSVPVPSTAVDWMSLVALGAFNTAIMLLIYLYALQRLSPSTCSGFIALEPVYAIFFAALFFDEPITPWIAVSVILILGASFTLLKIEKDHAAHIA